MTGFLLTISFILHLTTLLAVLIVWKKFDASDKNDIDRVKSEMEDILMAYSTEMKEENEAFLEHLRSIKSDQYKNDRLKEGLHKPSTFQSINNDEVSLTQPTPTQTPQSHNEKEDPNYTPPPPITKEKEQFGPSMAAEVLSLQKKGYSLDEIAKKVDKGKGEIELLIKFYQDGR
ncbi:hypothetical protein [Alkalihalobacillus sp. AL-G]|uniref:DUF6115 domain-containing protein n=1 Tax=Alkalihalobacillus sp. AL-G TaxID=2926399 RepID=UPI00272B3284|nr:hypothetical protein [Alkalihalobacillus sp. AL-G]WLD95181.1 hypothetical protein MOJ78_09965 [Alkalihalobacillus sp. AL-G]